MDKALLEGIFHPGGHRRPHFHPDLARLVRVHAILYGIGEPVREPGHRGHLGRRHPAGHLLPREPFQLQIRRPVEAPQGRLDCHGGLPLLQTFRRGCEGPVPRGGRCAHLPPARRRQHHLPTAGQEPLPPRPERRQAEARLHQVQGMGGGHQAGTRLLEG